MALRKRKQKKAEMQEQLRSVGYDYSTREARQNTATALHQKSKSWRTGAEAEWVKYNDYYNFIHEAVNETKSYCEENGLPWVPACLPDPYIMVESQITTTVPEPEFKGRDDDQDSAKAKLREYAVRFVCDNNRLKDMNTSNERRLIKLGDAFFKCYWDNAMVSGRSEGDIRIKDLPIESIYPDPSARERGIQAGQYVNYIYRLHKVEFIQTYRRELEKLGVMPSEILDSMYQPTDTLFRLWSSVDDNDDTVQVLEHWFKQPTEIVVDGETIPEGAVACSIQAGGVELKYIPNYWQNTWRQCKLFPFVHYWRIRDENQFYNKSELFAILDLVDAGDRKLATSLLNDAMMANDIIIAEEDALADGQELINDPGAVIMVKQNKANGVRRLGGLQSGSAGKDMVNWLVEQMQRANRNFETNQGKETTRQTTATALAMLREDAAAQGNIKTIDRVAGFERLYELIDWLVLEFYDTDRMIYLGAQKEGDEPINFAFNTETFRERMPALMDFNGNIVREEYDYWPKVDVTVTAGSGFEKSKAATMEALQAIMSMQVTADNYKIAEAIVDVLDIPQKQEITDEWERRFGAQMQQPVVQEIGGMPGTQIPGGLGGGGLIGP